jgi:hypothetical protein
MVLVILEIVLEMKRMDLNILSAIHDFLEEKQGIFYKIDLSFY